MYKYNHYCIQLNQKKGEIVCQNRKTILFIHKSILIFFYHVQLLIQFVLQITG